jgi:hypothetical protein
MYILKMHAQLTAEDNNLWRTLHCSQFTVNTDRLTTAFRFPYVAQIFLNAAMSIPVLMPTKLPV